LPRETIAEALTRGIAALARSSGSPRADAVALLERVLGRNREWTMAHGEEILSPELGADFDALCKRRSSGTPIAYILGSAGFYGREFVVDERVLIPRPETEHLVEEAIAFIKARDESSVSALDVGVGSGAIACTIAAETNARVEGIDVSREAVAVATENARRLNVATRCRFHHGDLVDPVRRRRFDVIVANLPYVPTADLPRRPDPASFEPREALDGGPDGLRLYRRLLPQIQRILKPGGLVLFEAAPPTMATLRELVQFTFPDFTISVGRDYAGLERYIKASAAP
jgi:release factor glutamine methyltransferase